MDNIDIKAEMTINERLEYMVKWTEAQLSSEKDMLADLSNISAIINEYMTDISWAGFYLFKETELVLGPFQGKQACNRIALGKGVCGSAFVKNEIIIVPDVHFFPGHIACDSDTNSEIVIPIIEADKKFGVLDIDSKTKGRFSNLEKKYLKQVADKIKKYI